MDASGVSDTGPVEPLLSNLELLGSVSEELQARQCDQTCQTENDNTVTSPTFSVFICTRQQNNASSQVIHRTVCSEEVQCKSPTVSRPTGPNCRSCCFTGYESVKICTRAMRDLCGLTLDVFAQLVAILPASADRTCDASTPDRRLIFLMKLKLGISYSSLAIVTCVSRTTVSRHFDSILRTLSMASISGSSVLLHM